jgi:glycosyltransferase involved in cell wall biosynthesis
LGAKVILDIHDILPEFYASKFNVTERSPFYRILMLAERLSVSFADHVIVSNDLWRETLVSRSLKEEKCSVFLNYPDQAVFYRRPPRKEGDRFVLLYPGTLNWHQGVDVAIRALSIVKKEVPRVEFHVYGEGREKANLLRLTRELGLGDTVMFKAPMPLEEIADVMADATIGLVPKRRDSFGNEAFSTKILEFMSLGVPVVAANTKVDRYYFDSSMILFFESGDADDLARRILELMKSKSLRKRLAENGLKLIRERSSWDHHKGRYLSLVDNLGGHRRREGC